MILLIHIFFIKYLAISYVLLPFTIKLSDKVIFTDASIGNRAFENIWQFNAQPVKISIRSDIWSESLPLLVKSSWLKFHPRVGTERWGVTECNEKWEGNWKRGKNIKGMEFYCYNSPGLTMGFHNVLRLSCYPPRRKKKQK